MKPIAKHAIAVALLMAGCGPEELTRPEALQILKQENAYPKVIDYPLFCSDGKIANKVAASSLVNDGYVVMAEKRSIEAPFFTFTEKAAPFLLAISDKEREFDIQKVRLADEVLVEVTGISTDEGGKNATVLYTTRFENISPFAILLENPLKIDHSRKAYFRLYDDGWRIEQKK